MIDRPNRIIPDPSLPPNLQLPVSERENPTVTFSRKKDAMIQYYLTRPCSLTRTEVNYVLFKSFASRCEVIHSEEAYDVNLDMPQMDMPMPEQHMDMPQMDFPQAPDAEQELDQSVVLFVMKF